MSLNITVDDYFKCNHHYNGCDSLTP